MFDIDDMFQWRRFITPSVVPLFFWVACFAAALVGLSGFTAGVLLLLDSPLIGVVIAVFSLTMTCLGVLVARLIAEFVLISFRTNDHIYAIRVLAEPPAKAATRTDGPLPHAA